MKIPHILWSFYVVVQINTMQQSGQIPTNHNESPLNRGAESGKTFFVYRFEPPPKGSLHFGFGGDLWQIWGLPACRPLSLVRLHPVHQTH